MLKILLCLNQALEKEMGERRLTFHRPCGISVLPKLDVDGIVGGTGARCRRHTPLLSLSTLAQLS